MSRIPQETIDRINDNADIVCGGFSNWNGIPIQIAANADDATTTEIDGFSDGDEIIW